MTSHPTDKRTIQERLRDLSRYVAGNWKPISAATIIEAADRIDALEAAIKEFGCCPACGGQGWVLGIEPGCCGNISSSGSCCGNPVAKQCQEQCGECDGTGLTIAARSALHPSDEEQAQAGSMR